MASKLAMIATLSDECTPVLQRPVVRAVLAGGAAVGMVMLGSSLYAYRKRLVHAHGQEAAEDEDAFATPLLRGDVSKSYAVTEQDSRSTMPGKADASLQFSSYTASHGPQSSQVTAAKDNAGPLQSAQARAEDARHTQPSTTLAAVSALTSALAADDARRDTREELYNTTIVARTKLLGMVRALLRQVNDDHGVEEDSEPTDSDTTDVSFNYHIAGELEDEARTELMHAMTDFEHTQEARATSEIAMSQRQGSNASREKQKLVHMLTKMIEYIDISIEREKLRLRREALHFQNGTSALSSDPAAAHDAPQPPRRANELRAMRALAAHNVLDNAPYDGMDDEENDNNEGSDAAAAQLRAELLQQLLASHAMNTNNNNDKDSEELSPQSNLAQFAAMLRQAGAGGAALDYALRHTTNTTSSSPLLHHNAEGDEMSEHGWDDGVEGSEGEEEAAFMAYLQQPDAAERFYSRAAMRAARRRPWDDVFVVDRDGHNYADAVMASAAANENNNMNDDDDAEDEWIDESESNEEENNDDYHDEEEGQSVEEWTAEERAEFEADLVARIAEMANAWGVTEAMAERELLASEAARLARHAKRTPVVADNNNNNNNDDKSDVEEGEEEDVWEDEDDEAEAANAHRSAPHTHGSTAMRETTRHAHMRAHGRH